MILLLISAAIAQADLLVLDNGAMRVELDARLFSVRYVGLSEGKNFVEPLAVAKEVRHGTEWADPGGLHTDVLPFDDKEAALRRGPADIVEHTDHSVRLVGPPSPKYGIRTEKEIRLHANKPRALYSVIVRAVSEESGEWAVRNTVRVPLRSTLRVDRADGTIAALAGTESILPAVVKSSNYWLIPVPPAGRMKGVALGAFVPRVRLQNESGVWTRRLVTMPGTAKQTPQQSTFVCVLDNETRSYGAMLQSETAKVSPLAPLVFREEWTIEKRGR
jgi:hypothetical protein